MLTDREFELCSPRKLAVVPSNSIRSLIAAHLVAVHSHAVDELGAGEIVDREGGYDVDFFRNKIPRTVQRWGKVRISGGGDTTLGSNQQEPDEGHRDASYIRVSTPAHYCSDILTVFSTT